MLVYHGTRIGDVENLFSGDYKGWFPGLYVTDTRNRAANYAAARATGKIRKGITELPQHAAIATIETTEAVEWRYRPESHPSLDMCENTIKSGKVVAVEYVECDYWNCTCHKDAKKIRDFLG